MVLSTPIAFARAETQTDSNGLTDGNAIIFANEALLDFHRKLIARGVDASQTQESFRNATADQGTYLYPSDMWFLKTIELNYTNTTAQDYKVAEQVDVSNLPVGSFGDLRTNGSTARPKFDDRGDQYEIFPTPTSSHDVSELIRLFYYLEPTQYAATGDTVAYPEDLDQAILGWRIAANYLYSLRGESNLLAGDKFNIKYQKKVKDLIETLSKGSQQPITAIPIQLTGFEF